MPLQIQNKVYKALIFDIDDTLIDTRFSYDEAIKKTVQYFTNVKLDNDALNLVRSKGMAYGVNNDWNVTWLLITLVRYFPNNQWENILLNHVIDDINPKLTAYIKIKDFFQKIYLGNPYFNGKGLIDLAEKRIYKNELFSKLKDFGVRIGIVSSRPIQEALYTLKNVNGLLDEFIDNESFIISVGVQNAKGEFIPEKPSPEPILECVKRLEFPCNDCVYIGNSSSDYWAARDAGVDFIQVGFSIIDDFNGLKLEDVNQILLFA
jgi:phosphoglycolate phosphatase-like HAD superfamily hydrolase